MLSAVYIYKGCIGTASSSAHVNEIRIRSGLAGNRIRSTLHKSGYDPDSCECAFSHLVNLPCLVITVYLIGSINWQCKNIIFIPTGKLKYSASDKLNSVNY